MFLFPLEIAHWWKYISVKSRGSSCLPRNVENIVYEISSLITDQQHVPRDLHAFHVMEYLFSVSDRRDTRSSREHTRRLQKKRFCQTISYLTVVLLQSLLSAAEIWHSCYMHNYTYHYLHNRFHANLLPVQIFFFSLR